MNYAPIKKYSYHAPAHLRGKEFLCPHVVRGKDKYPATKEDVWRVFETKVGADHVFVVSFKDQEEALHHARHLNFLYGKELRSQNKHVSRNRHRSSKIWQRFWVATLICYALLLLARN